MTETTTRSVAKSIALCLTGANIELLLLRLPVEGSDKKTMFLKFEIPNGEPIYVGLSDIREIIFNGRKKEATITYREAEHETVIRDNSNFWGLIQSGIPVQVKGEA